MSEIKPSTVLGIKRLAKSIKTQQSLQYVKALDEAAKIAGYQNFRHADAVLSGVYASPAPQPMHRLFITAYWKARDGAGSGRETLTITLSAPWLELISPAQLLNHRALRLFKKECIDHIVRKDVDDSQSGARSNICAAVRAFQFIDATKLRPSSSSRYFSGDRSVSDLPGRDHTSAWFDPLTKRYLIADEPYEKAVEEKAVVRQEWARRNGFSLVKSEWPGMYAPQIGSCLYLLADSVKGVHLEPLVRALEKTSVPFTTAMWSGESAPIQSYFASPGALSKPATAAQKPKVARSPTGARNSVSYTYALVGPARRPNARLPVEKHREVGELLKTVMAATYNRKGVYNRLNSIRSELDEWAQHEYSPSVLPNEEFFELYYRDSGCSFARSLTEVERKQHTQSLQQAKEILTGSYPDCAPLRVLVTKMDSAKKSLQSWVS